MLIHMIFGQRPDDVTPEVIEAWDEYLIEGNPEGFEASLRHAKSRVRDGRNPDNDFINVAVVVVQVNTAQIEKILNPPNKVMGTVVSEVDKMDQPRVSEALRHLRVLTDFAYKHGYHELGYDPVGGLAKFLNLPSPPSEE
jgi:hypothetical protein